MRSEHTQKRLRLPQTRFQKNAMLGTSLYNRKTVYDMTPCASTIDSLINRGFCKSTVTEYEDFLCDALQVLRKSPTARALIDYAAAKGWHIQLGEEYHYDYTLDSTSRMITLDHHGFAPGSLYSSVYFSNAVLAAMIRALRDVWHETRNAGYETLFNPESILLMDRIRMADIAVITVLVTWELRGEGYGELWRYMLGSEHSDLAANFANYLERSPCAVFTQDALAATFREWFRDKGRVAACDHETLNTLDSMIMAEEDVRFGDRAPTHIAIELLSCLPDKTAYLRGDGAEILRDPLYSGLDDPVNQAHLFQILHDAQATFAGNVAFRDAGLAARMFPAQNALLQEETREEL